MAWEAESRTAGGSFYVDRLLFYIQQSIEPVANLCGKLLVTIMLCKVADIREALVGSAAIALTEVLVNPRSRNISMATRIIAFFVSLTTFLRAIAYPPLHHCYSEKGIVTL